MMLPFQPSFFSLAINVDSLIRSFQGYLDFWFDLLVFGCHGSWGLVYSPSVRNRGY